MLHRSGGRRYPSLVPDLSGKTLSILSLGVILIVGPLLDAINQVEKKKIQETVILFPECFYHEICWRL